MGKDTTAFRDRFNAYKNGKPVSEIYDAGLPRYADGTELPIEQMMPYILAVENPTKQGLVNGVWRPPTDSSKWDTHAIGGGLDIREENNPIVYNYLKSKGRLNNPYLTVAEEEMLRKQTFEKTTLPALRKMYGKYKDKISEKGYARLAGMKWQGHPYLMAITSDSITGKAFLNAVASGDRDLDSVFDAYYKYPANAKRYGARINADVNYWKNYSTSSNVEPKSELVQLLEQLDKEKFLPWSNYHSPDYSLSNPAPSTISSWNNPTSPAFNTSGLYARRATNNINNVVQDILFNDRDVLDALMDNLSNNVFGGKRLGFKNGKLPRYKDGTRYLWDDQKGEWDRITDSDVANAMSLWVFTPTTTRAKFDYENAPNPMLPVQKNAVVSQDNNAWTKRRVAEESNKRTWLSDAADISHSIGEGAMLASTFATPELEPLVYSTYNVARNGIKNLIPDAVKNIGLYANSNLYSSNPFINLYATAARRYNLPDKARLPYLIRKVKSDELLFDDSGNIVLNGQRFGHTNFSYDRQVVPHTKGSWDNSQMTFLINPREIVPNRKLGSIEPSDMFTVLDPKTGLSIPSNDVVVISGNPTVQLTAKNNGVKLITSNKVNALEQHQIEKELEALLANAKTRFNFVKDERHLQNREYWDAVHELYSKFGRPKTKDVRLLEQMTGLKSGISSISDLNKFLNINRDDLLQTPISKIKSIEDLLPYFGNNRRFEYMKPTDYEGIRYPYLNFFYDPATKAESKFVFPSYKNGKSPIHIKPANRGKFTALKKRTGHSASWFKENGTPEQKKMAVFALNAKKWKH